MDVVVAEIRFITDLDAKRKPRVRAIQARLTREEDAQQSWDRLKLISLLLAA